MSDNTHTAVPGRRLIEEAFPLKKVSEDSKHEKSVRHGHISTLHIWPARRPLAASRAAAIAALLPDPGDERGRDALCKRIEAITRWGTETGPELAKLRAEIRRAYGGRPPKLLDIFAGGGAIPFEAMRLGCDVTAIDFNSVAWLLLRCTLEYPQRLAGTTWPIPRELERYLEPATSNDARSNGRSRRGGKPRGGKGMNADDAPPLLGQERMGSLADHVRAWGGWVLDHAREELAPFYPAVDGKTPLTYLWARTVTCPDADCGAQIPLLKTLWLSRAPGYRVALRLVPGGPSDPVAVEIWKLRPDEEPKRPVMASAKATCPRCGTQLPTEYLREQGKRHRMGAQMTAVVTGSEEGKIYRSPTAEDLAAVQAASERLRDAASRVPLGMPHEPINPTYLSSRNQGIVITRYGLDHYDEIFTDRALLALLTLVHWTQQAREAMVTAGYDDGQVEAVVTYLALVIDRIADYGSSIAIWNVARQIVAHTFSSFRMPMAWDFAELNPTVKTSGGYPGQLEWVAKFVEHALLAANSERPKVRHGSAVDLPDREAFDAIITDPPYYDAVPYADISDFFYVWLRRTLNGIGGSAFETEVVPKRGELVSNAGLFSKDESAAKQCYEDGMARSFVSAHQALKPDGIMVIVFAHKEVNAWETLVSAMIRAGWTITASWPIDTERTGRMRAHNSAALASSIWLVCRKRPEEAGIGRYGDVMRRMQERITERLRYFWDLNVSGPDFIWAAVGPALEAYSSFREVRRLDGSPFTVGEFLREVRRLVTDFALGQILHGASTGTLDETTRYYLMHRYSFKMGPAPTGECILLAQGYGLDLDELRGQRGILTKSNKANAAKEAAPTADDEDAESASEEEDEGQTKKASGSDLRLLGLEERSRLDLGDPLLGGGLPMIDMLHRQMRLWAAGQVDAVAEYAGAHGLGPENDTFWALAQSILEMAEPKSRERTLLEALVSWGRGRRAGMASTAARAEAEPVPLPGMSADE